ncbi:MAG: hypothetical protein Q9214_005368, partial [Letrouitia sp. 1 TL-2023]
PMPLSYTDLENRKEAATFWAQIYGILVYICDFLVTERGPEDPEWYPEVVVSRIVPTKPSEPFVLVFINRSIQEAHAAYKSYSAHERRNIYHLITTKGKIARVWKYNGIDFEEDCGEGFLQGVHKAVRDAYTIRRKSDPIPSAKSVSYQF